MANVFISHTGADIGWARKIHGWLTEDRHSVFLDVDQHDGVPVGVDWERLLFDRLHEADAMVCVISPAYLQSVWCAAEIGAARTLGTELLPVRVSVEPIDDRLLRLQQYVDAAADPTDARKRLQLRLAAIDGVGGWGWPEDKSPYPGLRPFELGEHRVFFGRSREITQIAERLRSPDRAAAAILTVVGASGCGKSSLVRAGVLPRIAGGSYWLPLPPMLPGTDPMGNLVRAMAAMIREQHIGFDVTSLRRDLDRVGLKAVSTDLLLAAAADDQCKLLIVIDQLEELLTQTDPKERAAFAAALAPALGGPIQVLATLRPEFLEAFATDPDLSKIALRYHEIRPLTADALRDVIEKPAKVAGLSFEDDLVVQLVNDTGSGSALPLLAFTLEQLAGGVRRRGKLTRQRYVDIGGVRGALQRQADAALDDACANTGATRDDVISALLDLVTIDEQGRPAKRRLALDESSNTVIAELEPFITRRLLSTETEGDRTFVAVAHEAFLVNWPPLKDEIDADVTALRARRVVENAADDWAASGRDRGSLLQGRQLAKAAVDTGAELERVTKPSDALRRTASGWSPGHRRLVTRVDLNESGREFLEASIRADRARRRNRAMEVVAIIAVLALITGAAVVGFFRANSERDKAQAATAHAQASAQRAIASRLLTEAADMLAQNRGDIEAFQKLLTADALAPGSAAAGMFDAVVRRLTTEKIIDTGARTDMALSPDGHRLASAHPDGTIQLWNADTGQPIGTPLTGHTALIETVAFSPDGHRLASASHDGTVRVWNADTGQPLGTPLTEPTGGYVLDVTFSPDGHRLASSSTHTVRLWNADTGQPLGGPFGDHTAGVYGVAFSPDGHRLAGASVDDTVLLWNADTGQPLGGPLTGHTDSVFKVAFSPDGHRLASTSADHTVRLWNADTGQPLGGPLVGHTESVYGVAFSPDGKRIVSGSHDRTVRLWDADTGQPLGLPLTGHTNEVHDVAFIGDGRRLASGSSDGTMRVWNVDAAQPLLALSGINTALKALAFSPDGHRLATASQDTTVRMWDADTGQPIGAPLTGHTAWVQDVTFSPDGHRLASASRDETVRRWDADTRQPIGTPLTGHTEEVERVVFSPDGRRLATASYDKTVRLWNADTGRPFLRTLVGHTQGVSGLAFSPDGHRLVSASQDGTVVLWNADTGQPLRRIVTGQIGVVDVAFSPDAHRLASAGTDATVRLWDADTGDPIGAPLIGHSDVVWKVAFSPDGHVVASTSHDKTVRLWNADTGQPMGAPLTGHTEAVLDVKFSPDGHRLASASGDGTVRLWPAAGTPEMLCDKLTTNMSRKQWQEWISTDPNIGYRELCPGLPPAA